MWPPPTTPAIAKVTGVSPGCSTRNSYTAERMRGVTRAFAKRMVPVNGAITVAEDGGPPARPWVDDFHEAYSGAWQLPQASAPTKSARVTAILSTSRGAGSVTGLARNFQPRIAAATMATTATEATICGWRRATP